MSTPRAAAPRGPLRRAFAHLAPRDARRPKRALSGRTTACRCATVPHLTLAQGRDYGSVMEITLRSLATVVAVFGASFGAACTKMPDQPAAGPQGPSAPPSTVPSATTDALKTYTNDAYGFEIAHPSNMTIDEKLDYSDLPKYWRDLPKDWRWNAPKQSKGKPIVRIIGYHVTNESSYPRDFDTEIRIGASSAPADVASCYKNDATGEGKPPQEVTINGIAFKKFDVSDAAMMHYVKGASYRTIHNDTCFAIEHLMRGSSYRDAPSPKDISQEELNAKYEALADIVRTFRFTK